jgi:PIN domain nuclease of toxin-antitoxin system
MTDVYLLDASALLAALHDEPGADRVRALLPSSRISSVNLAEVVAKLQERGVPDAVIEEILDDLDLPVVPFGATTARRAGMLRAATRTAGLSVGDRACLALATELGAIAVTTDRTWGDLELDVAVELLR